MARPPRDLKKDRLLSLGLFVYTYIMVGMAEAATALISYIIVFDQFGLQLSDIAFQNSNGWNIGPNSVWYSKAGKMFDSNLQNKILLQVNAAWFFTIVGCQCEQCLHAPPSHGPSLFECLCPCAPLTVRSLPHLGGARAIRVCLLPQSLPEPHSELRRGV